MLGTLRPVVLSILALSHRLPGIWYVDHLPLMMAIMMVLTDHIETSPSLLYGIRERSFKGSAASDSNQIFLSRPLHL